MANCRQDIVSKLCSKDEGLAVVFETVATIYQHIPSNSSDETDGQAPDENWIVVGYGIPSVVATESKLTLTISDFDQDLPGHEITITSTTQLVQINEYFTVIGVHNATYFGLCFADVAVAKKITSLISLVVSNLPITESEDANATKRIKLSSSSIEGESDPSGDNDWVMIDQEDKTTKDDDETNDMDGTDDVDSPGIFRRHTLRRKSRSRSNSPLTISTPSNFLHVSHVDESSSVGELTKSMASNVGEPVSMSSEPRRSQAHRESGTESTLSFSGVCEVGSEESAVPPPPPAGPPPPPPPAGPPPPPPPTCEALLKRMGAKPLPGMSLQDELRKGVTLKSTSPSSSSSDVAGSIAEELKRGIVLRPVGSSSKTLPRPPPRKDRGKLVFEINTFRRNTLRHVETKNMTDYQTEDPNSLESVLRSSLEKMRSRLNMRNFSRVAAVNGDGVEDGFEEDYDGTLIA